MTQENANDAITLALALGDTPEKLMRRTLEEIAKSDPLSTVSNQERARMALAVADLMRKRIDDAGH